MEVQEMRQVFIDSAVRVVARDGLEKTTTKAIASEAKLNEAYMDMLIHQVFSTMLFFASRVMNGEMENSEETITWAFEQIYSFVVPNVRAEVLEEEDKKEAL